MSHDAEEFADLAAIEQVREYFLDAARAFNDAFEPTICTFSVGYVYLDPATGRTLNGSLTVRYPALADA